MGRATLVPSRGKGSAGRSVQRQRFNQRQGFLVSAILHLTILMMLIAHPPTPRKPDEIDPSTLERKNLVYLPPAPAIRTLLPRPGGPEAAPAAAAPARPGAHPGPHTAAGKPEEQDQHRPALGRSAERADPAARGRPHQGSEGGAHPGDAGAHAASSGSHAAAGSGRHGAERRPGEG